MAGGLWMLLIVGLSFAAEEAPPPAGAEPPKAEAPAAAPGAPAAAAPAPKLPPYFTATSPDPKSAAVARSDRRQLRCLGDAGRRRQGRHPGEAVRSRRLRPDGAQSLFDQLCVGIGCRLSRYVHAGWLHVRRDRSLPREERFAHRSDESDDLSAGLSRLLGLRLCDRLGQLVERSRTAGMVPIARPRSFGAKRRLGFGRGGRRGGKGHRRVHVRSHRFEGLVS